MSDVICMQFIGIIMNDLRTSTQQYMRCRAALLPKDARVSWNSYPRPGPLSRKKNMCSSCSMNKHTSPLPCWHLYTVVVGKNTIPKKGYYALIPTRPRFSINSDTHFLQRWAIHTQPVTKKECYNFNYLSRSACIRWDWGFYAEEF